MATDIGQVISVTATAQDVTVGHTGSGYTLINDGTDDIYYREHDESVSPTGTTGVLIASPFFCAKLAVDDKLWVKGITWDFVCATGLSATMRVVPGMVISNTNINATVNLGANIGLLDKSETEIDPATEDKQDDNITQNTNLNTVLGATNDAEKNSGETGSINARLRSQQANLETMAPTTGLVDDGAVTAGNTGSMSAKLRSISRELGTIDADTNVIQGDTTAIKTAIELIDHLTASDSGSKGADTQRIVIATDDILTLAIKNALEGNGTLTEKVPAWGAAVESTGRAAFESEGTYATYVGVEAKKAAGVNTGIIYIGDITVDASTNQGHPVGVGGTWEYRAPPGTKFDLNDLYVDAAENGDGIVFVYTPA